MKRNIKDYLPGMGYGIGGAAGALIATLLNLELWLTILLVASIGLIIGSIISMLKK